MELGQQGTTECPLYLIQLTTAVNSQDCSARENVREGWQAIRKMYPESRVIHSKPENVDQKGSELIAEMRNLRKEMMIVMGHKEK